MAKEFAKGFYNSKAWKTCRQDYINKRILIDGGKCEQCNDNIGEEVHHIKELSPLNIHDTNITLNEDNLNYLCKKCHFKEHRERIMNSFQYNKKKHITNRGMYFDEDGNMQYRKVYIVYGSPRSGKTTYVREHKEDNDLVIDIDAIIEALRQTQRRERGNNALGLALKIRDYIYSLIQSNDNTLDCKNIWIVSGLPKKKDREELRDRLRAELIYIDTPQRECVIRAVESNEYNDELYSEYVVNSWWEQYEE